MFTERRSIRRYTEKPVEEEKLQFVIEAARWAPSWANTQCCELVVVTDPTLKKQLSETVFPKNPASLAATAAPVVLAVVGKLEKSGYFGGKAVTKLGDWFMYDLGLVTQNICLAAHQQGLGTVIVGAFNHAAAAELLKIPEGYELVSLVVLGYADHQPSAPKRKSVDDFVHKDVFGG